MAEQLLYGLQNAAHILLAPPNLVTAQQRRSAEEVFLNFRKTKAPYQLCRQILETNTNDYILFEAAGLIKIALAQEWPRLSKEDISSLRQYLVDYVINKPNLAPYVRSSILQVVALMIKRGSVDDKGQERHCMLEEFENLILTGDLQKKVLGCNFISAILEEYAITNKSSNIGLTLQTHRNVKNVFQKTEWERIFKFCLRVLDELVKKDMDENTVTLLKHLLPIVEVILTCECYLLVPSIFGECIKSTSLYSELGTKWEDVTIDPTVLDIFFTLYWKVRGNPQIAHHARTCLIRLATLCITIMLPETVILKYIFDYTKRFFELLSCIEIIDQEASSIASILQKLSYYIVDNVASIPKEEILKPYMEKLFQLTHQFVKSAAEEESLCTDECLYTEALDTLFNIWICISKLEEKDAFSYYFKESCVQIFNIYLQCHLSAPEGIRNIEDKELDKEETGSEEDDKVKFREQLQVIGIFGKQVPSHALPLLAQLIEDRTTKLREYLNKLVGQIVYLNTAKDYSIIRLYEDIHWLILITGHVLCIESEREKALTPSSIMKYSMEQAQQGKVDINLTLQLLMSSENVSLNVNVAPESVDHVIRLVADIFRLCAIEKTAMSLHLSSILSPELSYTIMWFLHKWSLYYFLPSESDYDEISVTFLQAFGEDSPSALWIINFLLEKIEYTIDVFKGEPELMKETINLLISLVDTPKKARCVLKSERFGSLVNLATKGVDVLPPIVKRNLMRAVIQVGVAVQNTSLQQCQWSQSLQLVQDRFKQIIFNEKFLQSYHQERIRIQIIDILESYIGVALGAHNLEDGSLFSYIHPVLRELPNLLSLYQNYQEIVQLILELFFEFTDEKIYSSLTGTDAVYVYEIILNVIQAYARCNINRVTVDSTAEEDSYQDILLLMKLLTNLIYLKETLINQSVSSTSLFESFLCGLNIITPLVTADLLKFPTLCVTYFEMMQSCCIMYCEEVLNTRPELFQPLLLASLELGIVSFGYDVTIHCCNILNILMRHIYSDAINGRPKSQVMVPFLNLLMNVILSHRVDSDVTADMSRPLYYLLACYKDEYKRFVESILATQTDPQIVQKLADAFSKLTTFVNLNDNRSNIRMFATFLDRFVVEVQGFLMVK